MTRTVDDRSHGYAQPADFLPALRGVLLHPTDFFGSLRPALRVRDTLVFVLLCTLVASPLESLVGPLDPLSQGSIGGAIQQLVVGGSDASWGRGLLVLALLPVYWTAGFFLAAALQHVFVMGFLPHDRGFAATCAVVGYPAATGLFAWVPVIGSLAVLYALYLSFVGIRELHQTGGARAFLVALAPFALYLSLSLFLLPPEDALLPLRLLTGPGG